MAGAHDPAETNKALPNRETDDWYQRANVCKHCSFLNHEDNVLCCACEKRVDGADAIDGADAEGSTISGGVAITEDGAPSVKDKLMEEEQTILTKLAPRGDAQLARDYEADYVRKKARVDRVRKFLEH